MAHQTKFNRILDRLYARHTDSLRHVLTNRKPGPPLTLTKKRREEKIRELHEIASKALAKKMRGREFRRFKVEKRTWRTKGKGWGTDEKRRRFRAWVREELPRRRGKVYVFWASRKCRYVGRTRRRGYRTSDHFKRDWFKGTTRIDIHLVRQRRALPLLECLTIHRFRPTENKFRAAKKRWTPRCPLCKLHKEIRTKLRKVYRFH